MTGDRCDDCRKEETADGSCRLSVCARCKSRRYCSRECQSRHWKAFHKGECGDLARQREERLAAAAASGADGHTVVEEGIPAVMSTRNAVTGKRHSRMSRPATVDHRNANVRQSIASMLDTMERVHYCFVPAAFSLARCYLSAPSLSDFQEALRENCPGATRLQRRIALGYKESEHSVLLSEMEAGRRRVLESTTLAVPPLPSGSEAPPGTVLEKNLDGFIRSKSTAIRDLRFVIIPYANQPIEPRVTALLRGCHGTIEHLDLTGSCYITDSILNLLADRHPGLEYLAFGQDNRYYPADDKVTLPALQSLLERCTELKFLRIFHPILDVGTGGSGAGAGPASSSGGGRSNNNKKKIKGKKAAGTKKALDPTEGPVRELLESHGFCRKVVPFASAMKREGADALLDHFWRADVEDGLISATWYQRGLSTDYEEEAFFDKHFAW